MYEPTLYEYFSKAVLSWYEVHGRKQLPWKLPDPYKIWVSEIMLQQTQVQTVIGYFNRFMDNFPTIHDLASAPEDGVLALWSGLGYYSRARNLHKTASLISANYKGIFPSSLPLLLALPGIGPSTAAAILSLAFNQATPILDGNVKRVLARFFMISGSTDKADTLKKLWDCAHACMPSTQCANYTQAIMDLGALCCTLNKPDCENCPLQLHCLAFKNQEQANYPNKKIKKPKPKRSQQFLVLVNDKECIYLEKRQAKGIWGGLWCLPTLEMEDCALQYIKNEYGLKGEMPRPIIQFTHHFTHFSLNIKALAIKSKPSEPPTVQPIGRWFANDELQTVGIARPTQIILCHYDALFEVPQQHQAGQP
ncbi:MAG: A/G-specific adenine glycosylase [Legionella sp.]|nr:A/G-specific adenine glycosylase [Legionella sp.]